MRAGTGLSGGSGLGRRLHRQEPGLERRLHVVGQGLVADEHGGAPIGWAVDGDANLRLGSNFDCLNLFFDQHYRILSSPFLHCLATIFASKAVSPAFWAITSRTLSASASANDKL